METVAQLCGHRDLEQSVMKSCIFENSESKGS